MVILILKDVVVVVDPVVHQSFVEWTQRLMILQILIWWLLVGLRYRLPYCCRTEY